MKKLAAILLCFILFSKVAQCQDGFYMEYVMEIGNAKEAMKTTNKMWHSNFGSKVQSEMNIPGFGPKKTIILMPKSSPDMFYSVDETKKTYTEIKRQKDAADDKDYTIEIVGPEKIGNYNCTHAKIKSKGKVLDVWVTKDIQGYSDFYNAALLQNGAKGLENAFKSKELEGIMVRMKDASPKEAFTMELVKFEKGNFPQTMFEIPAGYTKGASFDPSKMKDMTPEERQKMMEEMMKQYGKEEKQ